MEVEALKTRPALNPEYAWLQEAYYFLSPSRQLGSMAEYFIPLSEYEAYFNIIKLDDVEQRVFLLTVLTQVDGELLSQSYSERKNSQG